jgi:hypothetical protein
MYSIVLFLFIRILYAQGRTLFARICLASQIFRLLPHWIYILFGKRKNFSYHTCRGRRPRRPAPLAVSTAISFVLSAQCCSAQILDNLNLVTSSGTSHFCETEIEPFPYNVLVNFLLPQNRCRSLRIYVALRDKKAVQIEFSDITFIWYQTFMCFLVLFCTACRLTPIEALPQTPQGLCPLTPQAL